MKTKLFLLFFCLLPLLLYGQNSIAKIKIMSETRSENLFVFQFSNENGADIKSYSWKFQGGNPNTSGDSIPKVNYTSPGIYLVELTTVSSNGLSSSAIVPLIINETSVKERIDLSTAHNEDGTVMTSGTIDPNWFYETPQGERLSAYVKGIRRGWSVPYIGEKNNNTWITWDKIFPGSSCVFTSKAFDIEPTTNAQLFLGHWHM